MNRRRAASTVVTTFVLLLLIAVPSHGVTGWLTRATATSKGAGDMPTAAVAMVTVPRPHAVRVGVATPKGVSRRVFVDAAVECENGVTKEVSKRVRTTTNGSLAWITVADGSTDLGRACTAGAFTMLASTTRVRTVVQYKSR